MKSIGLYFHRTAKNEEETCDDTLLHKEENLTIEQAAQKIHEEPSYSGRCYVSIGDSTFSTDTDGWAFEFDKDDIQSGEDLDIMEQIIHITGHLADEALK